MPGTWLIAVGQVKVGQGSDSTIVIKPRLHIQHKLKVIRMTIEKLTDIIRACNPLSEKHAGPQYTLPPILSAWAVSARAVKSTKKGVSFSFYNLFSSVVFLLPILLSRPPSDSVQILPSFHLDSARFGSWLYLTADSDTWALVRISAK